LGCNNCNARNKASLWFSRQERSPAQSLLLALALCQAASARSLLAMLSHRDAIIVCMSEQLCGI